MGKAAGGCDGGAAGRPCRSWRRFRGGAGETSKRARLDAAPAAGGGSAQGLLAQPVMYGPTAELTYGFHGWDSRLQGGSGIIRAVAGEKQNQVWREWIGVFRN